jgi:hypothetical protein
LIRKKLLSIFFDISQNRGESFTKILYLILTILLFHFGCTDSVLDDKNQSTLDAYGELKRDTLYAIEDTFFTGGKVNTGQSNYLMVGSYSDYHTSFLIKFSKLPADTINVDTLRLTLRKASTLGDSSNILSGVIYRVTEEWAESVNADSGWEMLSSIDYSPLTSTRFTVSGEDSSGLVFDLPTSLVDIWRDTTAGNQNFGLLFTFDGAESIIKFYSGESAADSTIPRLIYIYRKGTSETVTYDTAYASQDASLIDFDGTLDANMIYAGAGYFVYSFIRFDFSNIPQGALISTANFFFTKSIENSIIDDDLFQGAYLRDVTTDYRDLPVFQIDSSFTQNIYNNILLSEETESQLSLAENRRGGAGSQFIQSIINGQVAYGSFYIEHYAKTQGISLYAMESVANPELSLRPFLVIEYYLPPNPRI